MTEQQQTHAGRVAMIFAILSLAGWIIPIIGIPLSIAGIYFGLKGWRKMGIRQGIAITICAITLIAAIVNAALGVQAGYNAAQEAQQTTQSYPDVTTQPTESTNSKLRNICLDDVNTWYDANRANTTTVYQEQNLLLERQQRMDECSVRYP